MPPRGPGIKVALRGALGNGFHCGLWQFAADVFRHQLSVMQGVDGAEIGIKALFQHPLIVRRIARLARMFQCRHDVEDVGCIVFEHRQRAVPDQRELIALGKEPGRGEAQCDFFKCAAIRLAADETTGVPIGQTAALQRLVGMHVPQFVFRAASQRRVGSAPLIGGRGIEEAPVHVGREPGEVMLQPLLAILAA